MKVLTYLLTYLLTQEDTHLQPVVNYLHSFYRAITGNTRTLM